MSKSKSLTVGELFEEYSKQCRPETGRKVQTAIKRSVGRADTKLSKITLLYAEHKRNQLLKMVSKVRLSIPIVPLCRECGTGLRREAILALKLSTHIKPSIIFQMMGRRR